MSPLVRLHPPNTNGFFEENASWAYLPCLDDIDYYKGGHVNELQTVSEMLKLAARLSEIVSEMQERKQSMLAEMNREAA